MEATGAIERLRAGDDEHHLAADDDAECSETSNWDEMAEKLHPGVRVRRPLERVPSKAYAHAKRLFDIAFSVIAIVVLSPVLVVCAIAVKRTSPGPVIFRQERWGRAGAKFECYKFRTMSTSAPSNMKAADFVDKDTYMTPVGNALRRWSLDELPQLMNVVKGDMSIIGPRPVIIAEEKLVFLRDPLGANWVRPGLSGWAQVNGRNLVNDNEKAFLDGEYVANMGFSFDARIFFRSIVTVLKRTGIDRDARCDADGVPY